MNPVLNMMVGVPGSGKSTYIKSFLDSMSVGADSYSIISTDKYVEKYAKELGKTYSEVFQDVIKQAEAAMNMELHHAILDGKNIIWDQTNLTINNRKKKLGIIPSHYTKNAVYFETPSWETLLNRFNNEDRAGKHIPMMAIHSMMKQIEPPTLEEGFVNIMTVKNF